VFWDDGGKSTNRSAINIRLQAQEMEEIYEFSKAFYNTIASDEEVGRELEKLEAEKKLKAEKSRLGGLKR
jgi:hypothetical protein